MTDVPLLQTKGLCRKSRWGTVLIEDIDFAVQAGERCVITGKSGSGKTVFLRALAILDPIEGELLWNGKPVSPAEIPAYRSQVCYLAQTPVLIEGTVEDNLRLPFFLELHKDKTFSREKVVRRLSRLHKSESFLQEDASHLSGGERQLVALLRVLTFEPDVLLLDEPTSALDPETEAAYEQMVFEYLDGGNSSRACLWVSHDRAQRERVADREFSMENPA